MRSLKMTFDGRSGAAVQWNAEVYGFACLSQKAVNAVLTQAGSDDLVVGRGTDALKELVGHGSYDLMAIQHTLNFAAQKAFNDLEQFDRATTKAEQIQSIRMRLAGITQNVVQAAIIVKNLAGETNNDTLAIA